MPSKLPDLTKNQCSLLREFARYGDHGILVTHASLTIEHGIAVSNLWKKGVIEEVLPLPECYRQIGFIRGTCPEPHVFDWRSEGGELRDAFPAGAAYSESRRNATETRRYENRGRVRLFRITELGRKVATLLMVTGIE